MSIVIDGRYIQDHFPGIGRYTYNLVGALARVAPDKSFVVLHNPAQRNTRYDVVSLSQYPNVEFRRVSIPTFSWREQFLISKLRSLGAQVQLFHSPYYVKPYFPGVPSVVTIFDSIPLLFPQTVSRRARWLFRWTAALAARTAARVIAPSRATGDDLVTRQGIPRAKITVIPLAAGTRFSMQPGSEIARVRAKYELPTQYVLSVGINKPHKNFETLLAAWTRVRTACTLVIAGAWDKRYAEEKPQLQSPSRPVRRIRNIDDADLPGLYAGATAFVMPSLYEGFGLPVLEAMACGAPVLASNTSSLPEVGGGAALYFDPRDADALASLITRVLNDRALAEDLRARSLGQAALFSWERTARETLAVYKEVTE